MLIPSRVYVASPEALFFEKALLEEPCFLLAGSSESGPAAQAEILFLHPDLLILDSALTAMDGLSLLDFLGKNMVSPPRVLFLSRKIPCCNRKKAL